MSTINISGRVHIIKPTHKVSEKFSKREIVIEVPDGKFPQFIPIEAIGDRIAMLDSIAEGDEVSVEGNLRGREWNGASGQKHFLSIALWKIDVVKTSRARPASHERPATGYGAPAGDDDSIPF